MNRIQVRGEVEVWGAHAPRVLALAPRQRELFPERCGQEQAPK